MASKFRESNTNIKVNLFHVIVMRPKLSRSAIVARAQLQKVSMCYRQIDALLRKMMSISSTHIGQILLCF